MRHGFRVFVLLFTLALTGVVLEDVCPRADAATPIRLDPGAPSWTKNMVLYQFNPRGFTSPNGVGDGNGSGTFQSAEAMLPYLHHLGVNAIWLSGFNTATNYFFNIWSVYATFDPSTIDPSLGTPADFRAFVDAAHANGIHVLLDATSAGLVETDTTPAGVVEQNPIIQEHPDWFAGELESGYMLYNWSNPNFRAWYEKVWSDYVTQYGVDGFRVDVGTENEGVWDQVRATAAASGHPVAIFGEGYHYDFAEEHDLSICACTSSNNTPQDLASEWNVLPFQYNSMAISIHDNGYYEPAGNWYTIQGNRAAWANGLLSPAIPIFYAGEEFDADQVPLPNLSPPGWLYGTQIPWYETTEPGHAQFLADSVKLLAIRHANSDLLNADRTDGGIASVPTTPSPLWVPWVKVSVRPERNRCRNQL